MEKSSLEEPFIGVDGKEGVNMNKIELEYLKIRVKNLEDILRKKLKVPFSKKEKKDDCCRKYFFNAILICFFAILAFLMVSVFLAESYNFFFEKPKLKVEFEATEYPKQYPAIYVCDILADGDLKQRGIISGVQFQNVSVPEGGSVRQNVQLKMEEEYDSTIERNINCLIFNQYGGIEQEHSSDLQEFIFLVKVNDSDALSILPSLFFRKPDEVGEETTKIIRPAYSQIVSNGVYMIDVEEILYTEYHKILSIIPYRTTESEWNPSMSNAALGKQGFAVTECEDGICTIPIIMVLRYRNKIEHTTKYFDGSFWNPIVSMGGVYSSLKIIQTIIGFMNMFLCFHFLKIKRKIIGKKLSQEEKEDFEEFSKKSIESQLTERREDENEKEEMSDEYKRFSINSEGSNK